MSETKKNYEEIMNEITSGLTGDSETDLKYLKETAEKYADHELGKEIARAIGRLIFGMLDEEAAEKISAEVEKANAEVQKDLEEVHFNMFRKNFDRALELMEKLIHKVESMNFYTDDEVSEYRCFDDFFEEILYRHLYETDKEIRRPSINYPELYLTYGSLLVEHDRCREAREVLEKGLHFNPVNFHLFMERCETFKMQGFIDEFFECTKEAFRIAYTPAYAARCWRNLGYYFVEKKLWDEATACYIMSLQFENESKQAQSELYYIQMKAGREIKKPTVEQMEEYRERFDLPYGADSDVISLAYTYGRMGLEENRTDIASYFLKIAYDLTYSSEIKELLDKASSLS